MNENYICDDCMKKLKDKKYFRTMKNVFFLYNYDKDMKKLITDYKFRDRKYLSFFIAELIGKELKKVIDDKKIDIVIPVPSDRERIISRGFNQVSLILDVLGIKYKDIERNKKTKAMHTLHDKNLRSLNIKSAFKIDFETTGKNILIFDDIITTGSTVSEIIKVIERNGKPKNIYIFSICVASFFYKTEMFLS